VVSDARAATDAGNLTRVATTVVYVKLLGEAVDVWRPVNAQSLGDGIYRITGSAPEAEEWEFPPVSRVRAEVRALSDGPQLAAVELVE
jgi:hypothetical protein